MPKQSLQGFKSDLFKALAHPTRIRILELLRTGEMTVTELQTRLTIESSSVSQQLGVLRAQYIVDGRKDGTSVYYRVAEPQVFLLLDIARDIFSNHLTDLQALADGEDAEDIATRTVRGEPAAVR